jgi:lipopolysaccharide export system protein LptA
VAWTVLSTSVQAQVSVAGFVYPVYYNQNELVKGQTNLLKLRITGESMDMRGENWLVVKMRLEYLGPDARTNFTANAPECLLNQQQKTAASHTHLTLTGENGLIVKGTGFFCNLTNMTLRLSNTVETVLREDIAKNVRTRRPTLGSLMATNVPANAATNATTNSTIATALATNATPATNFVHIFSDHLFFNYQSNTVTYTDNVRANTSQFEMACDQLDGKRSTNGAIESIVARQNVVFFNKLDQSSAYGDYAIYQMQEGGETLFLSGERARWQDQQREAFARRFWFFLKEQRLRAEENAYFRLPRLSLGQQSLLPGKPTVRTNAAPGDLEISAELVVAQLPTTNHPARTVHAATNVIIISAADKNRATGDQATYSEATGILELDGHAFWQTGDRIISGDRLFADRTNRMFSVTSNAWLRLPVAELGKQGLLSPFTAGRTNNPAVSNVPQFLEMWCDNLDYRSDTLTFRERVRGKFLEGTNALGAMNCALLTLRFNSNQVDTATAKESVHIEQFPYTGSNGVTVSKSLDCELLNVLLATNGWIKRVIAETNVAAVQIERSRTNNLPILSSLHAAMAIGEFFTHTNRLRELVAIKDVTLRHDNRKAHGQRGVYSVTNNTVELTGNPTADVPPDGRIVEAESLLYDLLQKKFIAIKARAEGERASTVSTNRSNLPFPK